MNEFTPAVTVEKPTPNSLASLSTLILLVDDDADICFFTANALADAGYLVDIADEGMTAWGMMNSKSYKLLITDYCMPMMSGLELIVKLRSAKMAMPVILVSGAMPVEVMKGYSWLYIDATLEKPYSFSDLLVAIKEVLGDSTSVAPHERS